MREFILFLFIALWLSACSNSSSGPADSDLAAQTAKVYYEQLLNGDYGSFVAGRYQPTELPASYREQLIVNAKMFIEQQEKEHKGIKSVSVAGGVADTTHHMADAFLIFTYGDGTKEQVVVPMVSVKNVWYMR